MNPSVDVYGVQSTLVYDTTPAEVIPGKHMGAVVRRCADQYEASSLSSGSKILVGWVPAKSVILPDTEIKHDALGTSVTLALKLQAASDQSETTVVAATAAADAGSVTPGIDDAPVEVDEDSYVILEVGGAAATGTINSEVRYAAQGG